MKKPKSKEAKVMGEFKRGTLHSGGKRGRTKSLPGNVGDRGQRAAQPLALGGHVKGRFLRPSPGTQPVWRTGPGGH